MENFSCEKNIKTSWIRQLKKDWKAANYRYFNDALRFPIIDLLTSERTLGRWQGGKKRTLSLGLSLLQHARWEYVQEVLYHEMAHQYMEEVLAIHDDSPHGQTFRKVCHDRGIDPGATGNPESWLEQKQSLGREIKGVHKTLNKVHKLFALAQSANKHEARLAMSMAQDMLLKYNISILEKELSREYIHKQIGEIGKTNPVKSILATILTQFFFVEAIWVYGYDQRIEKEGKILEIYGTPENVSMSVYVHKCLSYMADHSWEEYKKNHRLSSNKHRRTFIYGLLNGFYDKLDRQTTENKNKSLIWKGDPQLSAYYRRRNPKVQRGKSTYTKSCADTYNDGIKKGKKIVIHKGIYDRSKGAVRFLKERHSS